MGKQIFRFSLTRRTQKQQPLDQVAHLPDVSRPVVFRQQLEGSVGKAAEPGGSIAAVNADEVFDEGRYVLAALPQRRDVQLDHFEAMVQVPPELAD